MLARGRCRLDPEMLPLPGSVLPAALAGTTLLCVAASATPAPTDAAAASELGVRVYAEHCLECHGEGGRGDGPKAKRLGFRPRDFSLGSFKCRSTPSAALPTDEDLLRVVEVGLPGTVMKGLGEVLTLEERQAVVGYVKTFSPRFAAETPAASIEIPAPPPSSADSIAEGEQIYRALKCWNCHGLAGRGDGPAARGLKDDWGDPIRVFNFAAFGKFKCGGDERDLYRTLHTGMNGSPMASFTEAFLFAREDVAIVTALESAYGAEALGAYEEWVERQPARAALGEMPPAARKALGEERTWALVAYLKSLLRR